MSESAHGPVGLRATVEVGKVAHGGHFVARLPAAPGETGHGGQVVFVRHALPGERVVVEITEDSGSFLRGDAVEILDASPHRVLAPCPLAHPDGCGGCDFQHVELSHQRELKAAVVSEQLERLAGIQRDVVVEPVPGDEHGLRWRTRMQYVDLPDGRRGLRKYRSHEVVEVEDCLISRKDARTSFTTATVRETVGPHHCFDVAGDGFWQVHPGAPLVLATTVMEMLAPKPGERALDLYAGVGLFSAFLAEAVGEGGAVVAVESDRTAAAYAGTNLAAFPQAEAVAARVDWYLSRRALPQELQFDLVVLDPPRAGAKRRVVRDIAALGPRAVAYVACDPAALARDLAYFAEHGYRLADLRAFDLFPMTSHVECVALLEKTGSDVR